MRLLVVEDEISLNEAINEGLTIHGYAVDSAFDGQSAFELITTETYDLVILDLNLPHIDGMDLLKKIRQHDQETKFLILSARSNTDDKVKGLDLGASDNFTKPFDFKELEARVRALLRREYIQKESILKYHDLTLDTINRTVKINSKDITLTKKEYALLEYLIFNQNRVISSEELMNHVWNMEVDSFSNAVRVHIASLRKKIKEHIDYEIIQTKVGEGYYLDKGDKQ